MKGLCRILGKNERKVYEKGKNVEGGGCRNDGCGNRSSPYDGQPEKGRMYRLTDSNSSCKNKGAKGENQRIYYSKGNYEAFARPKNLRE